MDQVKGVLSFLWKCYVGIIFSIFALALYPFFYIILSRQSWKKFSFRLFVFWSWLMRVFCFYRVQKVLNSPLPKGPYVLVANHASYLDIFFMYSIFPDHPFLFLGKGEILAYPIIRTYFKGLNIPVHRQNRRKAATSFSLAKKAVHEGWSLVIFPEGGIPDDTHPKMIPFKNGAFKLAKALNVPIIPVSFTNHYKLFSDPLELLGPARPGISRVYIHPFISSEEVAAMTENALLDECFNRINSAILKDNPQLKDLF